MSAPRLTDRAPTSDVARGSASTPSRANRWCAVLLGAIAVVPVIAVVVTRSGRSYLPMQDFANIDLRVRDVWSTDFPLVGPYSRYGWNHPGGLFFWLLAPLSGLFGRAPWATQVGSALLQGVAAAWIAVVAWRHRGLPQVAFWLAVLWLGYLSRGSWFFLQPWGPHAMFPFFALFLCLIWLVRRDRLSTLPQAAFVATLLVQTHIGFAIFVAAGVAFVTPEVVRAAGGFRGILRLRAVLISIAVLAVLWFPVALDTVLHWPGNFAHAIRLTALDPPANRQGLRSGLGLFADAFKPLPEWLGGTASYNRYTGEALPASAGYLLVAVALLGLGAFAAWKTRNTDDRRLMQLTGLTCVIGVVSLAGVSGPPSAYLFYWRETVGALVFLSSLWCLGRWIDSTGRTHSVTALAIGCAAAVVIASAVMTTRIVTNPVENGFSVAPVHELLDQLARDGHPDGPVLVLGAGTRLGGVQGAVFNELERQGVDVRALPGEPFQWGRQRTSRPEDTSGVWYVTEGSGTFALLSALPGAEVIAQTHVLSPADEQELLELQRSIGADLERAGRTDLLPAIESPLASYELSGVPGLDPARLARLDALLAKIPAGKCRCAVIAFPPTFDTDRVS